MPLSKPAPRLLLVGIVPGVFGSLLAFTLTNLWFCYLGVRTLSGLPDRSLMPDFFTYLQIDVYVGAGCGYAGSLSAPHIAGLFTSQPRIRQSIAVLYTFILGAFISLVVNAALLFMSTL